MSAPLNSKTARELVEAYQSMYTTEEVEGLSEAPSGPRGLGRTGTGDRPEGGVFKKIASELGNRVLYGKPEGRNRPTPVGRAAARRVPGGVIPKGSTSSSSQGSSTQQPAAKPATAGTYSSQFKKSAPALSKTLTKKEPMMKSDLGGRLGKALSGKVSDFQFKDSYDMVLDYLLSGGHVESVEEAHYVMLEMDQETIQGICEGCIGEGLTGERYKEALKKGKQYSRKVSEDPAKRATRGGRGGESDFGAGDRGTGNKSRRRRGLPVGDED